MNATTQKVFLSLITFLIMACGRANFEQSYFFINNQIADTRRAIDSVRISLPYVIWDSLCHNPTYKYMLENKKNVAALRHMNDSLLKTSYRMAQNYSIITIVPRDARLFDEFRDCPDLPQIRRNGNKFFANQRKIREFDNAAEKCPAIVRETRNHFDSIALQHISMLQNRLDSLLDEKYNMILQAGHQAQK